MVAVAGLFVAFGKSAHPVGFIKSRLVCNMYPDAFQLNDTVPLVGTAERLGMD